MMKELAEFVLKFSERYDVLLDIKIKPMKKIKKNRERKDDVDEN